MSNLLALAAKAQAWLSGKKTYLVGAAMCAAALSGELTALSKLSSLMDLWTLVSAGAADPNIQMFLQGVAICTGRAAIQKAQDAAAAPAANPPASN